MIISSWTLVVIFLGAYYIVCVSNESSLIVFSGIPRSSKNSQTVTESWDACLRNCRAADECVVTFKVSDNECQIFNFGEISSIEQSRIGDEIAVKMYISSDVCPQSHPFLSSSVDFNRISNNQLYTTSISFDSGFYSLNYSITSCPDNTKLFLRETATVCIALFLFEQPLCNTQLEGSGLCKRNNGTLTGPANSDEYDYIQAQTKLFFNTSNPEKFLYLMYWIDGISLAGKKNYEFEDPTHNGTGNYKWAPNSPSFSGLGYCLYNPNPKGLYISDDKCNSISFQKAFCWRGAWCQLGNSFEIV